jgi:signal transduction histidine kinase/CheY-like chemotaxis protein
MTVRREHRHSGLVAVLVLVVLALVAFVSFGLTRRAASDEQERILHERAGEVAAILASSTNSASASLSLVGEVYASRGSSGPGFVASARSLLQGSVTAIGVAEVDGGEAVVRAVEGSGVVVGDRLVDERAALAQRALATQNLVSALVPSASGGSSLIVAFGRDDGLVVFEESAVNPKTPVPSTANSPFRELDVALYRSSTADPSQLLITTNAAVPSAGTVDQRTITVGAEQWLLVTSAHSPLTSAQARALPWIVLGVGLSAAFVAAAVVGLISRRRAYALDLVDKQTAELRQTLLDLETARAAADTANRAKSQFLSRMSHELRTPLNAVLGFAQLLELADLEEPDRDAVGHILKGGHHLLGLINEVLDISRIESGDLALSSESVPASDVITESIDLMRPLATARSISISCERDCGCERYVFADRQRLKQVLLNLLSNAVKYNRLGGKVTVSCEIPSPTTLRLNVTDTGPGISTTDMGLLFVPFERLGAHLTDVEGTGIGLALSKRLAEAMGGSLSVASEPGRGSTFSIEMPLVEGAVERYERLNTNDSTDQVRTTDGPHSVILYIEDNMANLKLVQRILANRGDIHIVPAMQGRLGLELARQHRPSLILLDLHLPDTDGDTVLQQLRDDPSTSSIPVVILSADATTSHIQRLQTAGASAYLTKPLNVRQLLATIDELLPSTHHSPELLSGVPD